MTLKRALIVAGMTLVLVLSSAFTASAQSQVRPMQEPEPSDTHCYPLSLFCGFEMQVGPFGPFDFFEGGSVFPPSPPPPSAQTSPFV